MNWKLFFYMFLNSKEIFFEFIETIDERIFNDAIMTNVLVLIRKFVLKHKKQPDYETIELLLDSLPEQEKENKKEYISFLADISKITTKIDPDVFKEELQKIVQRYEMEKFVLRAANKIDTMSIEDMLGDIRTIMKKYRPKSYGVDVTDAQRMVRLMRHDVIEKVTTGIGSLDNLLYGGFGINEIAIFMAPPGRGKSFALLNMMYSAMLAQKNVLYVTFELSEKAVVKRLYSRISYSSRKEMLDEGMVVKSAEKFFTLSKARGRIVYAPSKTMTVEGLEMLIDQSSMYFDFNPDIVIVDYLDLLAPRKDDLRLDIRHRLRGITDDLRSIALRRGIAVVTATQANREALSKLKPTEANVGESFGKVEVADVVIAICQTDDERKLKRARLAMLKNRDYVGGGCVEVFVDFDKMLLMDLDLASKMGLLEQESR